MALTQIWCNSLMSRRKGKVHKPYEFGVKVSVATTINRSKGGQFVTHIQALPGKPCDGHTLETVVPAMKPRSGHRSPASSPMPVTRATTLRKPIASGSETRHERTHQTSDAKTFSHRTVIGHLKEDHRMGRNHLAGTIGDAANAILAAVGYNFPILAWIRFCIAISGQLWRYPKRQIRFPALG
ncbi:hypothetical protein HFO26_12315 [Rhizobium leguminosarum]|nr:hypothetical protein [Rhizobium leguminosarum]